ATILQQQGDNQGATKILRQLTELRPTDPMIWRQLGRAAASADQTALAYRANAEHLFLSGQHPQALRQLELALQQARNAGDVRQEAALRQRLQVMANTPSRF